MTVGITGPVIYSDDDPKFSNKPIELTDEEAAKLEQANRERYKRFRADYFGE